MNRRSIPPVLLVAILLALTLSNTSIVSQAAGNGSAAANPPAQEAPPGAPAGLESSGAAPYAALGQERIAITRVIGDDPDENGYQGPPPADAAEPAEPSGSGPAAKASAAQKAAPQPDENGYATAPQAWSPFYYIYAAGSTLKPRADAERWNASGDGGCAYVTSNAIQVLNLHLDLPTGAWVEYLRIFYYDTSSPNSTAWLTTYDGSGGYTDVASVASAGTGGYGTALSAALPNTTIVDNLNNAYVLNWRPNATGTGMKLCGLRVAYHLPTP